MKYIYPLLVVAFILTLLFLFEAITKVNARIDANTTYINTSLSDLASSTATVLRAHERLIINLYCKQYPKDPGCINRE